MEFVRTEKWQLPLVQHFKAVILIWTSLTEPLTQSKYVTTVVAPISLSFQVPFNTKQSFRAATVD